MAKLPALLMAKKSTDATTSSTPGTRKARRPTLTAQSRSTTRPSTTASTVSSTQSRAESVKSRDGQSNQETHEDKAVAVAVQPRRAIARQASSKLTKKKAGGATSAVEDVERRRKLFAKWMKSQQDQPAVAAAVSSEFPISQAPTAETVTRLPPIHTSPPRPSSSPLQQTTTEIADPTRLPPLRPNALVLSVDHTEPLASAIPDEEPNLDDSLDEDEVNQLLNWTDNLLSPNTLESSLAGLDEDPDDMG
jgi:hypothetical protein